MSEEHIVPGSTPGQTDMARVNGGPDMHGPDMHGPDRQSMQGAASTKDVFSVDGTAGSGASTDLIRAFENGIDIIKVTGDIDVFWFIETENAGQPNERKDTILVSTDSSTDASNMIAIIEGFDAAAAGVTFDQDDLVGNGRIQQVYII